MNEHDYADMPIGPYMDPLALMERMGPDATPSQGRAMRRILCEDYMLGWDAATIPADDWYVLCDRAVVLAGAWDTQS